VTQSDIAAETNADLAGRRREDVEPKGERRILADRLRLRCDGASGAELLQSAPPGC
jgi:hypothetical protein